MMHPLRRGLVLVTVAGVVATMTTATAGAAVDRFSGSAQAYALTVTDPGSSPAPPTSGPRVDLPADGSPQAFSTTDATVVAQTSDPTASVEVGTIAGVELQTTADDAEGPGATTTSRTRLTGVDLLSDWSGGIQVDEVLAECTVPTSGPVATTSVTGLVVFGRPVELAGPTSFSVPDGDHEIDVSVSPGPSASSIGPHGSAADTLALQLTVTPDAALERPTVVLELAAASCGLGTGTPEPRTATPNAEPAPAATEVLGSQQHAAPPAPVRAPARFTG